MNKGGSSNQLGSSNSLSLYGGARGTPYLSKLESIASSAVRAADKVRRSPCTCCVHPRVCALLPASLLASLLASLPPHPLPACLPVQVQASLIVVYTHTGQTAEMVAKYRPPMPILTLVVPNLVSDCLKWKLEGR
jgi:pyruvate kinase